MTVRFITVDTKVLIKIYKIQWQIIQTIKKQERKKKQLTAYLFLPAYNKSKLFMCICQNYIIKKNIWHRLFSNSHQNI